MKFHFVFTGNTSLEWEAITEMKPPRLLLSYFFFKNKPMADVIKRLGYRPEIFFDSGAFSAHNRGKAIDLDQYMAYIRNNAEYLDKYINLDVIGDPAASFDNYQVMRGAGLKPVPVVHYGDGTEVLQPYMDDGASFVALGGTARRRDKENIIAWSNFLYHCCPGVTFHLLGSANNDVLNSVFGMESADASTWIMQAIKNVGPDEMKGMDRGSRLKRMKWHIKRLNSQFGE